MQQLPTNSPMVPASYFPEQLSHEDQNQVIDHQSELPTAGFHQKSRRVSQIGGAAALVSFVHLIVRSIMKGVRFPPLLWLLITVILFVAIIVSGRIEKHPGKKSRLFWLAIAVFFGTASGWWDWVRLQALIMPFSSKILILLGGLFVGVLFVGLWRNNKIARHQREQQAMYGSTPIYVQGYGYGGDYNAP